MRQIRDPDETPSAAAGLGEARRTAGLTQKALADRLGISLWEMERLERGETDAAPYLPALLRHTGQPEWLLRGSISTPQPATNGQPAASHHSTAPAQRKVRSDPGAVWLVLGSLTALVVIRFFTETVPVLPRAANVIDIPILAALILVAAFRPRAVGTAGSAPAWLVSLGVAFLGLIVVATLANTSRIDAGPELVFVYTTLSPLVLYGAVLRIWPPGNAALALRVLIGLGLIQLAVGVFYNVPAVIASGKVDQVTGTFGTNAYQFVFFLLVFVSALAALRVHMRGSLVARFAPVLIAAALLLMVLAQYRSLLPTIGFTLLLVTVLLGRAGGRAFIGGLSIGVTLIVILAFSAQHFEFLRLNRTLDQDPATLASKRLQITDQLADLYADHPRYAVTGTGPGTYSSRAWQTFALSESTSRSNVVGPYALAITGGAVYSTDVSERYVRPLIASEPVGGSYAVTTPYSSYISIAAEVGVLGMLVFSALYVGALLAALSRTISAISSRERGALPALLLAATVAFFALLQMGLLQSWLEATRLTFIAWILLAIATKEFDSRPARPAA